MLLAGAEEAAKEAVETWLRLYEDEQRAVRQYMEEATRAAPRSSSGARRLRKPSKKGAAVTA
jgi:hypothetical protein